jgi:hypothetical protein
LPDCQGEVPSPNVALQPRRARSAELSHHDTRAVGCKRWILLMASRGDGPEPVAN